MGYLNLPRIALIATCFLSLFSVNSYAESKISAAFFSDVAVSGYDAVAYFTEHKAAI